MAPSQTTITLGPFPVDKSREANGSGIGTDVDGKPEVEHVSSGATYAHNVDPSERHPSMASNGGRQYSIGGARRMSEWDALKIVKEGGVELDEEIAPIGKDLRLNPIPLFSLGRY